MLVVIFLLCPIVTLGCPNFGQNNWSLQCDFFGNDFKNIQVPSDRCGQACWDDPRCTHFTWTGYNGGTCWMKEGRRSFSDAVCSGDSSWVCGCLRDCDGDAGSGDLVTGVLTTFHGANEAGSCQLPSASYSTPFAVALGSIPSLKHITYRPSMCGKVLRVSGCGGRDIDVIVNNANIGGGLDLYGSSWNAATNNASPGQKFCNVQVTNNNLFSWPGYVCYYEPNSEHNNQYFHLLGLFNTGTNEVVSASLGGIPGAFNGIQPYFAFHGGPIGSDAPVKFNFKSGSSHTVALRDCQKVTSTQKWS